MYSSSHPEPADEEPPRSAPIDPTAYGIALADAVRAVMPEFVVRVVQERISPFATAIETTAAFASISAQLTKLGETIASSVDQVLRAFLSSDVDAQRTTPLTIIRDHMVPVTEFLRSVECTQATRDPFDESAFPNDVFAVGPHSWADLGEEVHEVGLRWGAAKAMAHRQRHRSQ